MATCSAVDPGLFGEDDTFVPEMLHRSHLIQHGDWFCTEDWPFALIRRNKRTGTWTPIMFDRTNGSGILNGYYIERKGQSCD